MVYINIIPSLPCICQLWYKTVKLLMNMYNIGFRLQVMVLELRKNLRYWIMILPIITLLLMPFVSFLSSVVYGLTLKKEFGNFVALVPKKEDITLNIDLKKYVDLKSGKRLFFSRVNNRENLKYGLRKLIYRIEFKNDKDQVVDVDNTKYETFMLPKEVFYISHQGSTNATKMEIKYIPSESDVVNVLPEQIDKVTKPLATLSNLNVDISRDDFFNINFLLNNLANKTINNLKFQYVLTNKQQEIIYVGNIAITELTDNDKSTKSVNSLSYPLNTSKSDLEFTTDNNKIRYNYLQYEF